MNKHFLLIISFGFLFLGMQPRMEAATTSSSTRQRNYIVNEMLMYACKNNDFEAANEAINAGADVNKKGGYGWTPLMYACKNENSEIVKILLDANADVNTVDTDGWTPLIKACWSENLEIVKMLLDAQADVNAKNKNGHTPLILACQLGSIDIVKMLLEHKAQPTSNLSASNMALIQKAQTEINAEILCNVIPNEFVPYDIINAHVSKYLEPEALIRIPVSPIKPVTATTTTATAEPQVTLTKQD